MGNYSESKYIKVSKWRYDYTLPKRLAGNSYKYKYFYKFTTKNFIIKLIISGAVMFGI